MPRKSQEGDQDRKSSGMRFARKLRLAFGVMLLVTLALAWYFYDSVEWYEHDVRRIALSSQILQNYQSLSNQTWRLLYDMDEAVSAGGGSDPAAWQRAAEALRETADAIRRDITDQVASGAETGSAGGLERLADIERVMGQILAAQESVAQSLASGDTNAASEAWRRLHHEGLVSLYAQISDSIIADQGEAVRRSQLGAIEFARYITSLLPILMTVLVVLTALMVWLFSLGLTRSVNALHDGASAFRTGDLAYRIPELREREFARLGEAFNDMARELADHRARLDEAKVRLEAVVDERTRALKSSNEKLAAIDDHRRRLLADISHEFRTPLTVIQGEAEIALRGKGKKIAEYRDSLQRILEQSKQTTRLVDDLLFIARAEVGEPRLHLGEAPVAQLLASVCEDFSAKAEGKGIEIDRRFSDGEPVVVADAGRLRQVFGILVDNALKYSREGATVEVGLENGADAVTITVSDRGIGLSKDDLKHVFQRFYRSKGAEGHDAGTGLGLPVAKAIVEAHGGVISLQPRSGGGITSTVCLPLAQAGDEPA